MNKEEILQASRKENGDRDIFELEVISKGQRIDGLITNCVAFLLLLFERIVFDRMNYGYFFIIVASTAGLFIYKAAKLKRKHEILLAIIWSVMSVYAAVMIILNFIG